MHKLLERSGERQTRANDASALIEGSNNKVHHWQCDQIGRFFNVLGEKYTTKVTQNICG